MGERGLIDTFNDALQYSFSKSGKLESIIRSFFKNVDRVVDVSDMKRQRCGVDYDVFFKSGEMCVIQVKWRKRKFSGDFLIEFCSVSAEPYPDEGDCKKLGWIYTIDADYIFVIYEEDDLLKVYPVSILKLVWQENQRDWVNLYEIPSARTYRNGNRYFTRNAAIPCNLLEQKMIEKFSFNYQRTLYSAYW